MDHLLAFGFFGGLDRLAERLPGYRHRRTVDIAALDQSLRDELDATRLPDVRRNVLAAGLQVDQQRRLAADPVELLEVQVDSGVHRQRHQVQYGIRRTAGGRHAGDRVLERLLREDIARPEPLLEGLHHRTASLIGNVALARRHRRNAGRAFRRDPHDLHDRRHRVGCVLAAARARARARRQLQILQLLVRHLTGGVFADRLENVLDRHVHALVLAGHDRPAIEQHRRNVHPRQAHRSARNRLIASDDRHQRIEHVPVRRQLNRVGDDFTANERRLHALRAHRDAVRDRDRVELHRRSAGVTHALLHPLGQVAQVVVARHRLDPCIGDADDRLRQFLIAESDRVVVRTRRRAVSTFGDDVAAVFKRIRHGLQGSFQANL